MRRFLVGAVSASLLLVISVPALGAPNNSANSKRVPVSCQGASVTVVLVPSIGKPLWDVSTGEATNGPNYMIKTLSQEIFVGGTSIGVFSFKFGNRTGQGAPITCTYEEHFVDGDGAQVDVYGTVQVVRK